MTIVGIQNVEHIVKLTDKLNEFFLEECKKDKNLKTYDLYIACKYLAYIYGKYLGPKAVKTIEENLLFIDVDNVKGSC